MAGASEACFHAPDSIARSTGDWRETGDGRRETGDGRRGGRI